MNDKKLVFVLGFLSFFLIAFMLGILTIVSAAPYYPSYGNYGGSGSFIRQGSQQLIDFFVSWSEPFLQAILGGNDYTGMLLFEKFLIYLLIFSVVYVSLSKVDLFDKKSILWTVSIIIPILAVRYIDFIWMNTLLLEYQVLGVALVGILPFIVYLLFLHGVSENSTVRKIGWIFFMVIYFGLWTTSEAEAYGSVYFWTMLIALVFLLMDGTIHRAFYKQRWREADRSGVMMALNHTNNLIRQYNNPIAGVPDNLRKKELRRLNRRKVDLQKQLT